MSVSLETKTDSAVKSLFEKVSPEEISVYRQKILGGEFPVGFESHETSVVVKAGDSAQVVLGGRGRPVNPPFFSIPKPMVVGTADRIRWLRFENNFQLVRHPRREAATNMPRMRAFGLLRQD